MMKNRRSSLIELEEEIREHLLSNLSSKEIAKEVIENLESDDPQCDFKAHSNKR